MEYSFSFLIMQKHSLYDTAPKALPPKPRALIPPPRRPPLAIVYTRAPLPPRAGLRCKFLNFSPIAIVIMCTSASRIHIRIIPAYMQPFCWGPGFNTYWPPWPRVSCMSFEGLYIFRAFRRHSLYDASSSVHRQSCLL